MSWVATAIAGGAVIGAGGSYLASRNANNAAGDIAAGTLNDQKKMYLDQLAMFAPYKDLGEAALPMYYAMLGLSAPALTGPEQQLLDKYNAAGGDTLDRNSTAFTSGVLGGYDNRDLARNNLESALRKTKMAKEMETLNSSGSPGLSPLAQWQQQEFLKSQNRQDAARGLAGSGGASARIAEGNSAIAANDYQAQYQRILDALKIGNNAAGSAGNSAMQYSSQIGQAGNTQVSLALDQGNTNAQLWQGFGSLPMDYYSLQSRLNNTGSTSSNNYDYVPGGSTSYNDKQLGLI